MKELSICLVLATLLLPIYSEMCDSANKFCRITAANPDGIGTVSHCRITDPAVSCTMPVYGDCAYYEQPPYKYEYAFATHNPLCYGPLKLDESECRDIEFGYMAKYEPSQPVVQVNASTSYLCFTMDERQGCKIPGTNIMRPYNDGVDDPPYCLQSGLTFSNPTYYDCITFVPETHCRDYHRGYTREYGQIYGKVSSTDFTCKLVSPSIECRDGNDMTVKKYVLYPNLLAQSNTNFTCRTRFSDECNLPGTAEGMKFTEYPTYAFMSATNKTCYEFNPETMCRDPVTKVSNDTFTYAHNNLMGAESEKVFNCVFFDANKFCRDGKTNVPIAYTENPNLSWSSKNDSTCMAMDSETQCRDLSRLPRYINSSFDLCRTRENICTIASNEAGKVTCISEGGYCLEYTRIRDFKLFGHESVNNRSCKPYDRETQCLSQGVVMNLTVKECINHITRECVDMKKAQKTRKGFFDATCVLDPNHCIHPISRLQYNYVQGDMSKVLCYTENKEKECTVIYPNTLFARAHGTGLCLEEGNDFSWRNCQVYDKNTQKCIECKFGAKFNDLKNPTTCNVIVEELVDLGVMDNSALGAFGLLLTLAIHIF